MKMITKVLTGMFAAGLWMGVALAEVPFTVEYGTVTLTGGYAAGHYSEPWDLTQCDLIITFVADMNGMVDEYGGNAHAWAELGVRTAGMADFNPNNQGVWLATDYDWTVNTFNPDPPGAPSLDLDDKFILQRQGGVGEGGYNLPSPPPSPWANHRIWFDRDGVDPWQALSPLAVDGGTYNTGGRYLMEIRLHADGPSSGQAYLKINDLDQGFETDGNWNTMELSPAGMTFSGDMTHMQIFYGIWGYGAMHSATFENITATGCRFNLPPDCSTAVPSVLTLWPANHEFVPVEILGVTDPDGDALTVTIDGIWQDEPVDSTGDGAYSPDGIIDHSTAWVRAERLGSGNGRVYHILFTADDGFGGTCSGEVLVGVPKSQGKKGAPVDGGALYDSTVP